MWPAKTSRIILEVRPEKIQSEAVKKNNNGHNLKQTADFHKIKIE